MAYRWEEAYEDTRPPHAFPSLRPSLPHKPSTAERVGTDQRGLGGDGDMLSPGEGVGFKRIISHGTWGIPRGCAWSPD